MTELRFIDKVPSPRNEDADLTPIAEEFGINIRIAHPSRCSNILAGTLFEPRLEVVSADLTDTERWTTLPVIFDEHLAAGPITAALIMTTAPTNQAYRNIAQEAQASGHAMLIEADPVTADLWFDEVRRRAPNAHIVTVTDEGVWAFVPAAAVER